MLDLMFFSPDNEGFDNHNILPDKKKPLDHTPPIVCIGIAEVTIKKTIITIPNDSEEERKYLNDLLQVVSRTNIATNNTDSFKESIGRLMENMANTWHKYATKKSITRYSKQW